MVMMEIGIKKLLKSTPPTFLAVFSQVCLKRVVYDLADVFLPSEWMRVRFNVRGYHYV